MVILMYRVFVLQTAERFAVQKEIMPRFYCILFNSESRGDLTKWIGLKEIRRETQKELIFRTSP